MSRMRSSLAYWSSPNFLSKEWAYLAGCMYNESARLLRGKERLLALEPGALHLTRGQGRCLEHKQDVLAVGLYSQMLQVAGRIL